MLTAGSLSNSHQFEKLIWPYIASLVATDLSVAISTTSILNWLLN